ncbi:EF-hand domain-containing protein [Ruegeria sediminis]|uniref:EF-hand domain-containing protein n=1 Tax=Ruegeria sediminis TaxID=2583820 RepID=A0ABY2X3L7_9RHOB|nr:EF-hand domain-containing protein [Ruegeria sediminis]TMV09977.1 EF-hand domain-containing protein [Ruegeria sediminis]
MRSILLCTAVWAVASSALADGQKVPGAHFIENWDLDGDGQVTVAETANKRGEIFAMFDQNGDGALDQGEYDLFDETRRADIEANAGGRKGPMQVVDEAMDRRFNDLDGDGAVSRAEFDEQSATFFGMIDRNGDGVVTGADFKPQG